MKIIEDKENELLNREEVKIIVEASKTPNFEEAQNIIKQNFKAEQDLIVVKNIKGKFGRSTFLIVAFVYKDKKAKEEIEGKEAEEKKEAKVEEKPIKEEKIGGNKLEEKENAKKTES